MVGHHMIKILASVKDLQQTCTGGILPARLQEIALNPLRGPESQLDALIPPPPAGHIPVPAPPGGGIIYIIYIYIYIYIYVCVCV